MMKASRRRGMAGAKQSTLCWREGPLFSAIILEAEVPLTAPMLPFAQKVCFAPMSALSELCHRSKADIAGNEVERPLPLRLLGLQLALEFVEKAPVRALSDDLLWACCGDARLLHA